MNKQTNKGGKRAIIPYKRDCTNTLLSRIVCGKIDYTSGSLAAVWIVVIVSFLVLMLSYTTFYGVVIDALYQMVAYYTGNEFGNLDAANKVRVFFTLFPRFFMPAVLLWAFMMSFRRERDDYRMQ